MNYLVQCRTPDHTTIYLNPLHIVIIEPLAQSEIARAASIRS